jgi:hypothetical protein
LLGLGGLAALGCGGETEGSPMTGVPWHMWGNEQTLNLAGDAGTPVSKTTSQLVKVAYGRPETWRAIFVANLLDIQGANLAGTFIAIDYTLIVGVGRASQSIKSFVHFTFDPAAGPPFYVLPAQRWAGSGLEPARTAGGVQREVDQFVAQDIQCSADVTFQVGGGTPYTAVVSVAAFLAPNAHVRPEWFNSLPNDYTRFRGRENGGL